MLKSNRSLRSELSPLDYRSMDKLRPHPIPLPLYQKGGEIFLRHVGCSNTQWTSGISSHIPQGPGSYEWWTNGVTVPNQERLQAPGIKLGHHRSQGRTLNHQNSSDSIWWYLYVNGTVASKLHSYIESLIEAAIINERTTRYQ